MCDTDGTEQTFGKKDDYQIDPRLLEILVCPVSKAPLVFDKVTMELISEAAGLAFPIRNGLPILLVDEARPVDEDLEKSDKPDRQ
ncbi:MAG: hypothetical protein CMM58_06035 [Rhodospirillaceae bacterium]|nr:hypothetical protein [Rhodospirillaceae bacterium]|tara:strand:+ start:586 stop:840 length:255 start_codon:yes stop_codon:yes gene_type:complete